MRKKGNDFQTYLGTAGLGTRFSTTMKARSRQTPSIIPTRTDGADQPSLELSLRPYTSRAIPAVNTTAPITSIGTFSRENSGRKRHARTVERAVRMRQSQNIDLQPAGDANHNQFTISTGLQHFIKLCLHARREPTTVPMVDPKGAQTVYIASALLRASPSSNFRLKMARPFGACWTCQ